MTKACPTRGRRARAGVSQAVLCLCRPCERTCTPARGPAPGWRPSPGARAHRPRFPAHTCAGGKPRHRRRCARTCRCQHPGTCAAGLRSTARGENERALRGEEAVSGGDTGPAPGAGRQEAQERSPRPGAPRAPHARALDCAAAGPRTPRGARAQPPRRLLGSSP